MTLLHVSDLHFNRRWFNWLSVNAPAHDLLVISGDLLNHSDVTPLREQIDWVSDWMEAYPRPMCVVSGSHDLEWSETVGRWTPAYWLRALDGSKVWTDSQRVVLDGLSILNIGCTTRPKGGEADIWVVHTPPAGTKVATRADRADGRDDGDLELARAVRRYAPRLILSGGVHSPAAWRDELDTTVCLNPGRLPDAPYPNHILLNTEDMDCRFITAERDALAPVFESETFRNSSEVPAAAMAGA